MRCLSVYQADSHLYHCVEWLQEQLEILNVAGTEMQQELTAREEEIEQKARLIGEMKEEMR